MLKRQRLCLESLFYVNERPSPSCVWCQFVDKDILRVCYQCSDVHVSASDFETLGNTVHESLLCGTPVVAQEAGGYISQVNKVETGSTKQGFLVDFENTKEVRA